ncbi:hypothetical protein B0H19DRAFT_1193142 [Mycena capillaripes]|nr:hypothetical protein B0H19DRAFT_1193142 [Mycena capillaripes]
MTLQLYNYAPVPPPQASSRPRSRSPPRVPPHPRSRSRSRSPLRAPPRRRSRSPPRAPPRPRSASPNAGDKRPRSSSLDSDDLRSTQSPRTTGSNGRPRAKDLDDRTREYAVLAMDLYRCYLSTENAFPDSAEENTMIRQSWRTTCEEMGENMILTPAVAKLIASRGSRLRGELKTKIRPLVDAMYRFESGQNRKTTAANRKLAEDLKEGTSYAFKDCENKKGLYKHPIIQSAVNSMWFANRRDEGPRHPELFNPLRLRSLAVVLTAVENNIDERLTGVRTDVPFTANDYRAVYEAHIKALEDFNVHTGKYALLEKILKRLHNVGRFHSGAQSLQAPPTSTFSKSILDAALKEYEEGATTDDSSETEF